MTGLMEQYIDGVYDGIKIANNKLKPFDLKIEMPEKDKIIEHWRNKYLEARG